MYDPISKTPLNDSKRTPWVLIELKKDEKGNDIIPGAGDAYSKAFELAIKNPTKKYVVMQGVFVVSSVSPKENS